jgi:23S rRNA pseudouridine1911/1915/1917 synthase
MTTTRIRQEIPGEFAGQRLDQALATLLPDYTRSQLQQWIEGGHVRLEGELPRKKDKLKGGETVEIDVPPPRELENRPQPIPLDILHEDSQLIVIAKPAGLIVHPGAGNPEGTLLNALLHHAPALAKLARAGIVHRLDKDTSGLLVVAKTEKARQSLIEQLAERTVTREYVAVVNGVMISGTTVDAPIGRHPSERTRMSVTTSGKEAISHFRVLKKYRAHTLVQASLESGRTHQIRVHLAHLKYPIVGDPVYGGRLKLPREASQRLRAALQGFRRQALHAVKLVLEHPGSGKSMQWMMSVPEDMSELMEALAEDAQANAG